MGRKRQYPKNSQNHIALGNTLSVDRDDSDIYREATHTHAGRIDCAWMAVVEEIKFQVSEKRFYYYMADVYLAIQQQAQGLVRASLEAGVQLSRVRCVDVKEDTEGLSFVAAVVERLEVSFFKAAEKEAFEDALVSSLWRE
jgi:hypothetical protein